MERNDNIDVNIDAIKRWGLQGIEQVLDEDIIDAIRGTVDRATLHKIGATQKEEGALVLTSTRIVLYHYKLLFGTHISIELPLQQINDIDFYPGLLFGDIIIHTAGDKLTLRKSSRIYAGSFVKKVKSQISNVNNTNITIQNSPTPQAPNIDIADQIKKLADLKTQGFLTEEEFTAQKKRLLGL